jgi:hypothetical protein
MPATLGKNSSGRLLVSTWDAVGAVYMLENVQSGDPKKIKIKTIAKGLAEPLGLKVVGKDIYVLQKQELTKLVDNNGDDIIDEYQCFAKGWKASANFHEFAFGLAHKGDYLYAALATAIMPGGASARPQIVDRREQTVTVCQKDGGITVLTDEQAVNYNAAKFSEHFRKAGQAHKRTLGVDTTQLSDDGKRRHERGVILQAAMLSAAMNAKNQVLRLQPHQRNIPQMKPPENGGGK